MRATEAEMPAPVVANPVANREAKHDRLSVISLAQASFPPPQVAAATDVLRQAYASSSAADIEAAKAVQALPRVAPQMDAPAPAPQTAAPEPAKSKAASKPAPQKSYALLSD